MRRSAAVVLFLIFGCATKIPVASPAPDPQAKATQATSPEAVTTVEPQVVPTAGRKRSFARLPIVVDCDVDAEGNVIGAHVREPLPAGLDQATIDAIRRWKFKPGTLNGRPVDSPMDDGGYSTRRPIIPCSSCSLVKIQPTMSPGMNSSPG
jgi:TonB family protein